MAIYSIKKISSQSRRDGREKAIVGVRSAYLRVVGIKVDGEAGGSVSQPISATEEEQFRRLAASSDVYERICNSIAPSIFGAKDIKKAIACLLFGGNFFLNFE